MGVAVFRAESPRARNQVVVNIDGIGQALVEPSSHFEARSHYGHAVQEYLSGAATLATMADDGAVSGGAFFVQRAIAEQAGPGEWFYTATLHVSANGVRCPMFFLVHNHVIAAMAAPAWYPPKGTS
jgi:hypothetical protein